MGGRPAASGKFSGPQRCSVPLKNATSLGMGARSPIWVPVAREGPPPLVGSTTDRVPVVGESPSRFSKSPSNSPRGVAAGPVSHV